MPEGADLLRAAVSSHHVLLQDEQFDCIWREHTNTQTFLSLSLVVLLDISPIAYCFSQASETQTASQVSSSTDSL